MEIKNKKIVAGMMAGFCVLSTQSVLGNFSKLPMRGGNGLISYAMVDDDYGLLVGNVGILDGNNVYGDCEYILNYEKKEAELKKCKNIRVKSVKIPEYVMKGDKICRVTSVGERAFGLCTCLNTVTLSKFVKSVGYKAFDCCFALRKINILGNAISIDEETLHYMGSDITIYMLTGAVECWKTLNKFVPSHRMYMVDNIDEID